MNLAIKPNFFILGAAKAGTTSLHHYLSQHPDIFMPEKKETVFFNYDPYYEKGLDWYLTTHFSGADAYPAKGEADPAYLLFADKVAPRIATFSRSPPLRFIVIFRDPVDRAYSHYRKTVLKSIEHCSFEEALKLEDSRFADQKLTDVQKWGSFMYFREGLYGEQMATFLKYFDKSCFLFLFFDDLKKDAQTVCRKIFFFLGIDDSFEVNVSVKYNVTGIPQSKILHTFLNHKTFGKSVWGPLERIPKLSVQIKKFHQYLTASNTAPLKFPPLSQDTEKWLRSRYREDILRLQGIIGADLSGWLLTDD